MPIFEFKCTGCELTFERILSSSERNKRVTTCRMCGDEAHKIMSATNFKVEGYSEDNGYADKGAKKK